MSMNEGIISWNILKFLTFLKKKEFKIIGNFKYKHFQVPPPQTLHLLSPIEYVIGNVDKPEPFFLLDIF